MKRHAYIAILGFLSVAMSSATSVMEDDAREKRDRSGNVVYGDRISLGNGRVQTLHISNHDGSPSVIGVEFSRATLANLPQQPNDGLNCWDSNGDNSVDLHDECSGGHNRVLFLDSNRSPFSWVSIDWEPHGHVPEDVYGSSHFDFHFYMLPYVERNKIAVGPCPGTINCAQYNTAIKPVPAQYIHPDFFNTNLAFSRMGNHWADRYSPEFNGSEFTHTFILGSYDGRITFYEPMVSLTYLNTRANTCAPIKQPLLYDTTGYYPTSYCIRYHARGDKFTVTLERFVYRLAS